MAYADDLIRLRKRMIEALELDVVNNDSKELYEATLIQIMNESERQRQTCVSRAEDLRRQAAIADGQAHAFIQVSSIIYSVFNGYVGAAEKQRQENINYVAQMAEKQAAIVENTQVEPIVEPVLPTEIKDKRKKR